MNKFILGLLVFSSSAFALNVDLTDGKTEITSTNTMEISDVKLGGLGTPVTLQLTWNSVSNAFDLTNIKSDAPPVAGFEGVWKATVQGYCTGEWKNWTTFEFRNDGTCTDRGMKCTWTGVNGDLDIKWPDFPTYVIAARLVNGNLEGTVVNGSTKWCWKASRASSLINLLSQAPNFNSIPF